MKQLQNIIRYLVVFLANLLMLLLMHGYLNLVILICMLAFPLASLAVCRYVLAHLSFSFSSPKEQMYIEDIFYLRLKVKNPTFLPMLNAYVKIRTANTFAGTEGEHELNIPVYARGTVEVKYPLTSENLGILKMELVEVRLSDWLGFVSMKKPLAAATEIVLLPHNRIAVEPDLAAVSGGMTELEESRKKGNDFSEVQDVREYIPGDKLQNIHWKLSAKRDMLMVKDRVSLSSSQMMMVVELYQNDSMILDRILSAAFGTAVFFLQNQIPFTICWWSVKNQEMMNRQIDHLAGLKEWLEYIYYERFYTSPNMAGDMFLRLAKSETRFLSVTEQGVMQGDVLFTYAGDVEGTICS